MAGGQQGLIALSEAAYRLRGRYQGYKRCYEAATAGALGTLVRQGGRLFIEESEVQRIEAEIVRERAEVTP